MNYIYKFSCPITAHVVYVGITTSPEFRKNQHIKGYGYVGKWATALKYMGKEPLFEVICSSERHLGTLEDRLIKAYSKKNMANFNINGNNSKHACSYYKSWGNKVEASPVVIDVKKQLMKEIIDRLTWGGGIHKFNIFALERINELTKRPK